MPKIVIYTVLAYNFEVTLAFSLKILRSIFPLGFFGMASINSTPPLSLFGFDTFSEN